MIKNQFSTFLKEISEEHLRILNEDINSFYQDNVLPIKERIQEKFQGQIDKIREVLITDGAEALNKGGRFNTAQAIDDRLILTPVGSLAPESSRFYAIGGNEESFTKSE